MVKIMTIESFSEHFVSVPTNVKMAKYVTIFLLRHADSECIFRTDKMINNELTHAGIIRKDLPSEYYRVFLSKRKQIAPERRTGRELLRQHGFLNKRDKDEPCEINKAMCGKCIDCTLYGSAVGADSRKSHVVSDESFSLLPYNVVTTEHTFNALYENGTMMDDGTHSQSIQSDEVVKMGTIFLDMETITDVTMDEFLYILGNIIRTKRYGAMSSRLGKMTNTILGIAFSNCELFSNLEFTQQTYDILCDVLKIPEGDTPAFPLDPSVVRTCAKKTIENEIKNMTGTVVLLNQQDMGSIMDQASDIYGDEPKIKDLLKRIDKQLA